MRIDIIMATYNGSDYLVEQLESILNQSHQNWRLMIFDDGSTDDTVAIIKKYVQLHSRITLVIARLPGRGVGAPLNFIRALKHADAPYVCFCDQDDIWLDNKLELQISRMMQEHDDTPVLLYTLARLMHSDQLKRQKLGGLVNVQSPQNMLQWLMLNRGLQGCVQMINRPLVEKCLAFEASKVVMHDHFTAMVAFSFGRVIKLEVPTVHYRIHSNNQTTMNSSIKSAIKLYINHQYLIERSCMESVFSFCGTASSGFSNSVQLMWSTYSEICAQNKLQNARTLWASRRFFRFSQWAFLLVKLIFFDVVSKKNMYKIYNHTISNE